MADTYKYLNYAGLREFLTKIKYAYAHNDEAAYSAFEVAKLATPRTIQLVGDVTGSVDFDGSANVQITAAVGDDSHNHTLSTITDLKDAVALAKTEGTVTGIVIGNNSVTATLADGTVATTQAFNESAQASDRKVATLAYVIDAINKKISATDAMLFKGVVNSASDLPSTGYEAGWTYKVGTAGTYAGKTCEVGDMIIAVTDYTAPGAVSDWAVIQTNIDGAVTGPSSSVDGNIPVFSGTSGKVIADGSIAASNIVLKTQKVNNKALSGDITLDGSDIALTGYAKASAAAAVAATDTVNQAIGKLEYKLDNEIDTARDAAIAAAIADLDVADIGGSGKMITTVGETDGEITATAVDLVTTIGDGASSTVPATASAVKSYVDTEVAGVEDYVDGKIAALDYTDSVSGDYVTSVSETDGVIAVTKGTKGSIASGNTGLVDGGTVLNYIDDTVFGTNSAYAITTSEIDALFPATT